MTLVHFTYIPPYHSHAPLGASGGDATNHYRLHRRNVEEDDEIDEAKSKFIDELIERREEAACDYLIERREEAA
jgi:hypothetical protein